MKRKYSTQAQSILRRFFTIFIVIFLLFSIMLIPLFLYLQNVFTELQIEKSKQQLNTGVTKLQEIVVGMMNISDALLDDTRFISLSYTNTEYSQVNVTTRNQLNHAFSSLIKPYDEITYAALQLKQNVVLTNDAVFFEDINIYYPDFFCVNDLSFEEWALLLEENKNRLIPASRIKTYTDEYEALIYPVKWRDSAYLYACIDVEDIKSMLIAESDREHCYYSIMTLDGILLYSDLPEEESDHLNPPGYTSITEKSSIGSMQISIHIENSIFYQKMQPLYYFMAVYCSLCIIMFFFILFMGIRFSSRPILNVDRLMNRYQSTIIAQNSILQARFLEQAMNGQLASARDIEQFHTYFPDFPSDGYCLLLLRLVSDQDVSQSTYNDPLWLLQSYLEEELSGTYLQKISDSELLFLIAQEDYKKYEKIFDFVINNVNTEEPLYKVSCVVSNFYDHVDSLPAAYRQIQNMTNLSFPCKQSRVCTVDDCKDIAMHSISLAKLIPMYSAITSGNREMSMEQLRIYSKEVHQTQNTAFIKQAFEIIRTILLCIKLEYPALLIDENIPTYNTCSRKAKCDIPCDYGDIYLWLGETIDCFCTLISNQINETETSLVKRLVQYIDANYTDCDLCLMSLETHFNCASSTMRSLFKEEMNITITGYIEQKRMQRANELLLQNQKPIKDIALECGFSNANSFYKAYKRVYGCSPTKTVKATG